ncbi:MAG: hypothetical protein KGV59_06385 [Tenacibaculum sp.]|nr:hypothetical protein [Tenacibaculum sp.]
MAYKIKFIKNPPTAEDLITLYKSDLYNEILTEFGKKFNLADSSYDLQMIRQADVRLYLILNIPFEEVLLKMQEYKDEFLSFCIAKSTFYENIEDEHPDGEFPEGEEPDEEDKSEVIEELGIARTFLLRNFCEFYLLKNGDKERTLHFLKTTKIPYAKKHLSEITKVYKNL